MVETSSGSDSAPRRLQCEVEGHPLPTVTWLSASGSLSGEQVQSAQVSPYRLVSSVPYLEEDVFTCRVENRLGGEQRRYPPNTVALTVTVYSLILLLLLLLLLSTGFIFECMCVCLCLLDLPSPTKHLQKGTMSHICQLHTYTHRRLGQPRSVKTVMQVGSFCPASRWHHRNGTE